MEHLGDERNGVLTVDKTGFAKKGAKSVCVSRQCIRTAGAAVNYQVGVFLTYTSQGELHSWTGPCTYQRAASGSPKLEVAACASGRYWTETTPSPL